MAVKRQQLAGGGVHEENPTVQSCRPTASLQRSTSASSCCSPSSVGYISGISTSGVVPNRFRRSPPEEADSCQGDATTAGRRVRLELTQILAGTTPSPRAPSASPTAGCIETGHWASRRVRQCPKSVENQFLVGDGALPTVHRALWTVQLGHRASSDAYPAGARCPPDKACNPARERVKGSGDRWASQADELAGGAASSAPGDPLAACIPGSDGVRASRRFRRRRVDLQGVLRQVPRRTGQHGQLRLDSLFFALHGVFGWPSSPGDTASSRLVRLLESADPDERMSTRGNPLPPWSRCPVPDST